jgi:hypothetical protein
VKVVPLRSRLDTRIREDVNGDSKPVAVIGHRTPRLTVFPQSLLECRAQSRGERLALCMQP